MSINLWSIICILRRNPSNSLDLLMCYNKLKSLCIVIYEIMDYMVLEWLKKCLQCSARWSGIYCSPLPWLMTNLDNQPIYVIPINLAVIRLFHLLFLAAVLFILIVLMIRLFFSLGDHQSKHQFCLWPDEHAACFILSTWTGRCAPSSSVLVMFHTQFTVEQVWCVFCFQIRTSASSTDQTNTQIKSNQQTWHDYKFSAKHEIVHSLYLKIYSCNSQPADVSEV